MAFAHRLCIRPCIVLDRRERDRRQQRTGLVGLVFDVVFFSDRHGIVALIVSGRVRDMLLRARDEAAARGGPPAA